jgi:hypothetical protein
MPVVSSKVRGAARGQDCVNCGSCDDTVVLAHRNVPGFFGMGQKGPDHWSAFLCFECHELSEMEHRKDAGWWEPLILKTQLRLIAAGIIKIAGVDIQ